MAASSSQSRRKHGARLLTKLISASGASLEWPDPSTWPTDTRAWFNAVRGKYGPKDLFLFGQAGICFACMEDAYTCAALLAVDETNWCLDFGYPILVFDRACLPEYSGVLKDAGYKLHVKTFSSKRKISREDSERLRFARVIDISIGRVPELFKERQ